MLRLLLLRGGPGMADVPRSVPSRVIDRRWLALATAAGSAVQSVGLPAPDDVALQRRTVRRSEVGEIVVANTLVTLPLAAELARRRPDSRLVCHVHELDGVARRVMGDPASCAPLLHSVRTYIAAGPAVTRMLVERWGVPAERVVEVDPWVDFRSAPPRAARRSGPPVVLAVGSMRRRKGPDRFIDLMSVLSQHRSRPRGCWVGVVGPGAVLDETRADVGRAGVVIDLVDQVDDIAPLLSRADLVVSTALEDPYPLVALEAAAAGIPVAGFDAGGLGSMLAAAGQSDAVVDVDDLLGLADVVALLLDRPEERRRRGRVLVEWVRRTHSTEQLAPLWWNAVHG